MHDITVLDGGMGRELARMGAPFRQPEWSALALMEAPHYVSLAHDAFVAAGADVITANSYAVVPFHIGEERFRCDGVALAALAGQLARQAADRAGRPVRVAGSLPPTGGSYRPDLFDAARADAILATLVDGLDPYVDLWLAETQSLTDEIGAVRRALGKNPKPLWVSFTLRDDVDVGAAPVLRSGQTLDEAIDAAMSARANEELHGLRGDIDPPGYARWAEQWLALGAQIVGGCCGIGPDHIAALRDAVDARGAGHTGCG
ncbi:homocysteine S-methyltransferase family protein [Burkholderia ubonensis]|uniref:homocysteine S-methyltransferase family protein n=1 Tax=Burkholderia ubonensis TaxID=101571 RepID=UPI002AB0C352|nr:homocysteine S-methyltransferase family protein [Burkholderia ubonensis]